MTLVWVHHDAISRAHPVFEAAGEGARAVFVFDAEDYRRRGWSLKRILFVMECVGDAGLEVLEGDALEVLRAQSADTVFVARTPDPRFREVIAGLRGEREVQVVKPVPFARPDGHPDLRRFFRYWKKARKSAMRPDTHA